MVNFPIQISVTRRDASGVESRATHYEGSCNVSDMTEDASGETATIAQTPEDAAGGSIISSIENRTVWFYDEENKTWHKQLTFALQQE